MFWIMLLVFSVAHASPIRVCVSRSLSRACNQMAAELPETFSCVTEPTFLGCVKKVENGDADLIKASPESLYLAGKFFKLHPITTELIHEEPFTEQVIALVKKDSDIQSAADLRNRNSCFTGMGHNVGWKIPVGRLLSSDLMSPDCEDGEMADVQNFFDGSCVPGQWSADPIVEKKLKATYSNLCSRCKNPSTCAEDDAYAGNKGVLQCLDDGAADVAFTNIPALKDYLAKNPEFSDTAEILCFEGGRKSVVDNEPCVWGVHPTNVFLTRSNDAEEAERMVDILLETQSRYSVPQVRIPDWYHKTFLSHSNVSSLRPVGLDRRNYTDYLGDFVHAIRKSRKGCEKTRNNEASFCVISEEEHSKCEDFSKAAEAMGFWLDVTCVMAPTKVACMQILKEDNAKMLVLDRGDAYTAGRYFDLQPIASVLHNGADASYYAVAVLRSTSNVTKLSNLRGLRSCHTGFGETAGWVMAVGALVGAGLLPSEDHDYNQAKGVADFFSAGSCVPGANDDRYNLYKRRSEDLCKHCVGDEEGQHKCSRDSKERFSGYAGALRCLAEGKGDVAFVKHSIVPDHTDGHSQLPWAKDLLSSDFKLLCDDGGTASVTNFRYCNLGKVPSTQVVINKGLSEKKRMSLARLLVDIFTNVKAIPFDANYEDVLGQKFVEASKPLALLSDLHLHLLFIPESSRNAQLHNHGLG